MKIAYFTESLYPLVDGVSRTLARLFEFLQRRDVEFRVFSPFAPDEGPAWSKRVRAVPYFRFPLYPDYRVSLPTPRVARDLAEYRADVVHVVSPTPMAVWAQHWARRRDIPVVASFHTHFVSYFRYYGLARLEPLGWRLLGRFYGRCQRVYAPTRRIIAELEAHGIPDLELWSRGIDLARFDPRFRDPALRAAAGADDGTPIVLLVSRLVKEKDLLDLVPMHSLLRARRHRYRLVLVGDGPLRPHLEAALPDAYFAGHQSGDMLSRWFASGDIFVFPSTTETFGNVVTEAHASGLPAVVVDRGGPPEQVQDGITGHIARPNDPADLAGKVERLLGDPAARERMGQAARASAAPRDWEAVNETLLASYGQVIEQRASRVAPAARA